MIADGAKMFQIKNPSWADYWQQQAYAVMLVIRKAIPSASASKIGKP